MVKKHITREAQATLFENLAEWATAVEIANPLKFAASQLMQARMFVKLTEPAVVIEEPEYGKEAMNAGDD